MPATILAGGGLSPRNPGEAAQTMAESGQAPKAPAVDPLIGRSINDRFKITALIARGGMGKVYRAEQAPLGRACAVKVLNPNYSGEQDPEFHKRFFLEASIASKLTHPNTVTIFDYGRTEDDVYYMAMELLEGVTLHRAIREAGRLPEERVAHIGRQICRALREAHSAGVIHRDLKPANIFLVEHGDEPDFVKVLDFGLVKNVLDPKPEDQLTQTGLFMGSPKYMAPEQVRGDKVDARTDVYSLGIMMYEMLTGKVPFDRPNSMNILMAHVNDDAPPIAVMNPAAQVSPLMEELVARCMAKDPEARCSSMDEVLFTLKQIGNPYTSGSGQFGATSGELGPHHTGPQSQAAASGSMPIQGVSSYRTTHPPIPSVRSPMASSPPSSISSQQVALPLVTRPPVEPSATPPPTEMPDLRRGRKALAIGVVCALAATVGLGVAFAVRGEPGLAVRTAPAPQVTAIATAPAATATTATATSTATSTATENATGGLVHVISEPAGAVVKEDGKEVCPSTPCDHDFGADGTREHKLVFYKPGFRLETRLVHAGDPPVSVKLAQAKAWSAPGSQAKPADSSSQTPQGFKEIPY
jgi:eukaryotic-like serine/threonine-protein kinase